MRSYSYDLPLHVAKLCRFSDTFFDINCRIFFLFKITHPIGNLLTAGNHLLLNELAGYRIITNINRSPCEALRKQNGDRLSENFQFRSN